MSLQLTGFVTGFLLLARIGFVKDFASLTHAFMPHSVILCLIVFGCRAGSGGYICTGNGSSGHVDKQPITIRCAACFPSYHQVVYQTDEYCDHSTNNLIMITQKTSRLIPLLLIPAMVPTLSDSLPGTS